MVSECPDFIARYWGKAQPQLSHGPRWHPLAFHALDVAACATTLLDDQPRLLRALGRLLGLEDEQARAWSLVAVALHDLGKFTPAFQAKSDDMDTLADPAIKWRRPQAIDVGHAHSGGALWDIALRDKVFASAMMGTQSMHGFKHLYLAACGHHGRPAKEDFAGADGVWRTFDRNDPNRDAPKDDALSFVKAVLTLLAPEGLTGSADEAAAKRASWLVAGIVNLCDWAGSDQEYFSYRTSGDFGSLEAYWAMTITTAKRAMREKGLLASVPAPSLGLRELLSLEADIPVYPTPLQRWAHSAEISALITEEEPVFSIIEDFTGAGKTEAAALLAHRIMAAGGARGLYWALPTQATSNAIHRRFKDKDVFRRFYAKDTNPSIVNAHGGAKIAHALGVRARANPAIASASSYGGVEHDPAEAEETRWLHDDRRTALFADIGVGTIDQALLAVLPSKFNVLRLLGLSKGVLIIDEAHSYDPYMNILMERLITFQSALGGSVIVLSATLASTQRRALATAFALGVGVKFSDQPIWGTHFPSALLVAPNAAGELQFQSKPLAGDFGEMRGTRRDLPVDRFDSPQAAEDYIISRALLGDCCVYVRNTVGDARESFKRLSAATKELGGTVTVSLFHARFCMADRTRIEEETLRAFGKDSLVSERMGRILVATQVIEQSLDLDFDVMVTDLAPIDLLIQRAGRLHRHSGRGEPFRRPDRSPPRLAVVAPEPSDRAQSNWFSQMFPVAKYVYPNVGRLWAGLRLIQMAGGLKLASENPRDLLDRVYEWPIEAMPEPLGQLTLAFEQGTQMAQRGHGIGNALDPAGGYAAGGQGKAWEDEARNPTRLGEMGEAVRLVEMDASGALVPLGWSSVNNRNKHPQWLDWATAEIRLRRSHFAEFIPADAVELAAAQALTTEWRARRDMTPLVVLRKVDTAEGCETWTATIRILRASRLRDDQAFYDSLCGWRLLSDG